MKCQEEFISYGINKLHYIKMGEGARLILAFHGFGSEGKVFTSLAKELQNDFTFIAFDLPFHGSTQWNDESLSSDTLMAIVRQFKNDLNVNKVSLMGYSMGARFCLQIVEMQPDWIDEVFLLAPDGLVNNRIFKLATNHFVGTKIFTAICNNPNMFLRFAKWINYIGILNKKRYQFLHGHLDKKAVRERVRKVWLATGKLTAKKSIVQDNCNRYHIGMHVFMGRYDGIFPPRIGMKYLKGIENGTMNVLDCGHNFLKENIIKQIAFDIKQAQE